MTMTTELLRTPLHDWHVAHGGRMVDFAGWSMPVQYTSITAEHQATRNAVGVFDISHMGRLQFFGPDAARFLDAVVTRRVADMRPGQIRYGLVCNAAGGILDDVLVYRLPVGGPVEDDTPTFQMVVNASNRAKIVDWLLQRLPEYATRVERRHDNDRHDRRAGPAALEIVQPLVNCDFAGMRYYTGARRRLCRPRLLRQPHRLHRRRRLRNHLLGRDRARRVGATDRGRRDPSAAWPSASAPATRSGSKRRCRSMATNFRKRSIRFKPGWPSPSILATASSSAARRSNKAAADTNQPVRVGLQLDGKRVPRQGSAVILGDETVGEVTSGTFSPTFERPIAMAYVRPAAKPSAPSWPSTSAAHSTRPIVVPLPFYERGSDRD